MSTWSKLLLGAKARKTIRLRRRRRGKGGQGKGAGTFVHFFPRPVPSIKTINKYTVYVYNRPLMLRFCSVNLLTWACSLSLQTIRIEPIDR